MIARYARVRIEDSSRNRFALNGIQRDIFRGAFYPDTGLEVGTSDHSTDPVYDVNKLKACFRARFNGLDYRGREPWISYKFLIILETYTQGTSFVSTSKPNGESSRRETSICFGAKRNTIGSKTERKQSA